MDCHYCVQPYGSHAKDCPKDSPEALKLFHQGWTEGREGAKEPSVDDPAFKMGFSQGQRARQESQAHMHKVW